MNSIEYDIVINVTFEVPPNISRVYDIVLKRLLGIYKAINTMKIFLCFLA